MREFRPVPKPEPKAKAKPKPIKARSAKRAKQEREYTKLRNDYLAANPTCEGQLTGCTGVATELHHSIGRVGELLSNTKYFKASCHNCNMRAETHPNEAMAKGFIFSRIAR